MVKFLVGEQYDGEGVKVCTYWSEDFVTDTSQNFAPLRGQKNSGQCIANHYFRIQDISCFNEGDCNGEGKCLPCTKYRFDGMQLGITHSPPLEVLRQFSSGLTEAEVQSPNLAKFPPELITKFEQDQTPYHILIKNIQAKIAKCCHWSQGNGAPSEFFLASIVDGPDTRTLTDITGEQQTLKGIIITNDEFPDDEGVFFPVGSTVVAGFAEEPSFYIEPRTGLVKEGEGVIFPANQSSPVLVRLQFKADGVSQALADTVNATIATCNELTVSFINQENFFNNALNSRSPLVIEEAEEKLEDIQERQETACDAAEEAQTLRDEANDLITSIFETDDVEQAQSDAQELGERLQEVADKAEEAAEVGGGTSSSQLASNLAVVLRRLARDMQQAGKRSFSKCEFFFEDNNVAKQWNDPEDGTLPCNGVRTDCDFYTGDEWEFATEENLDVGKQITADVLQEVRFRSDDWERFDNPAEEFESRFSTPFIWAFSEYVDVAGTPDLEDMLLYRPKVLFGRGTEDLSQFETIELEKVSISDFDNFRLSKSRARIQPGSEVLNKDQAPDFPTLISSLVAPSVARLKITHPRREDSPFIYRTWSPDKNKITLFGTATPEAKLFFVNETALQNRQRYHDFLNTKNVVNNLPTKLPGSPNFSRILSSELQAIFKELEDEQRLTDSQAPLGFASTNVDLTGFWQSTTAIDLIHNEINKIFVFLLVDNVQFIFDSVEIDYRFLHAIPIQTGFTGIDFSMNSTVPQSTITSNASDTAKKAEITASFEQIVGDEEVSFGYGYYGLRFRDRGLIAGILNADNDLQPDPAIADDIQPPSLETAGTSFINATGYHVVQYKKEDVSIEDWYVINDCGFIMIKIEDSTANRVLPLPNQAGNQTALSEILVNGGGKGSEIAQFGIQEASITTELGEKKLVQIFRDPDGFGLPANYVVLGPSTEVEEQFGRPNPETDSVQISYTYLQAQTGGLQGETDEAVNEDEVVEENFHSDTIRTRPHRVSFDDDGVLTAGGDVAGADEEEGGPIRDLTQEYVWVFTDEEGRPIGRKYTRMLVLYYGLSAINVEVFYGWEGSCTTYGLSPDLFLSTGTDSGRVVTQPQGVTNPDELVLGFRLQEGLLGSGQRCTRIPSCADHEFLRLNKARVEFEVIERFQDGETQGSRAVHVGAGARVTGEILSSFAPGTTFQVFRGGVWYPFDQCTNPRYDLSNSIGPLKTQSTELINEQTEAAGINVGVNVLSDDQVKGVGGTFGALEPPAREAYRGIDLVQALVVDVHPTLRACTSAYTYANRVLDGRSNKFIGGARRRGELDLDIYEEKGWRFPIFGNLGRNMFFVEVSELRGDFRTEDSVGFRWMPVFPTRESLGAGIELFSENLEPQLYRLLQQNSPAGEIDEEVDTENLERYTHKALIRNAPGGNIDYPSVGFYPRFLSDNLLGKEPEDRKNDEETAEISTMWAWREQEKPIERALIDELLAGVSLRSPDYILDNRSVEVQLRPEEGEYTVTFTAPTYDIETGEIDDNATLRLGSGPEREIIIDFVERNLAVAEQEDTVYDTSLEIGDGPFPCEEGTEPDNENFSATCTCETDTQAETVDFENLPSRFLHLDDVVPEDGFFVLYESEKLQTPYTAPLVRENLESPCCQCVYYIRGIFARLDVEYLPTTDNINPAFNSAIEAEYTWSRVPHGLPGASQDGQDGAFRGIESLTENYLEFGSGEIFATAVDDVSVRTFFTDEAAAVFPSTQLALKAKADGSPIEVVPLDVSELKLGAVEASEGESKGEDELIVLDFRFNTYVQINSVKINFLAGKGWQVPKVELAVIDPQFRGEGAPIPTFRFGRPIAESSIQSVGTQVPNPELLDQEAVQEGLEAGVGANLPVVLIPSYTGTPFWSRFGMEFHLVFDRRDGVNSMGIAAIELNVEAFVPDSEIEEEIRVNERRYYVSTGSPAEGVNPDARLFPADDATVYWRTSEQEAERGANKFRAYAWDVAIDDDEDVQRGEDPRELERLQEEEYDNSRELFESPYEFIFQGFSPIDEREALEFYGGDFPEWTNNLSLTVSKVNEVSRGGAEEGQLFYGEVPERQIWNAPGHAWSYNLEETYTVCGFREIANQLIDYNFAHLHDNLDVVETAAFWDELPTGFTRLLRSTQLQPDPFFGQGNNIPGAEPGGTGQTKLINQAAFEDISPEVLEAAGFRRDENGNLINIIQGGE